MPSRMASVAKSYRGSGIVNAATAISPHSTPSITKGTLSPAKYRVRALYASLSGEVRTSIRRLRTSMILHRDPGTRIDALLDAAVAFERRLSYFDHQSDIAGSGVAIK
jgi:hypothetical protein